MKFKEIKGDLALEVLADIIEPSCEIATDKKIVELMKTKSKAAAISYAIRNHKESVIQILAALDCIPVEKYEVNLLTLPFKILEILNDPEVVQLFTYQEQMGDATSSTPVSVNTED